MSPPPFQPHRTQTIGWSSLWEKIYLSRSKGYRCQNCHTETKTSNHIDLSKNMLKIMQSGNFGIYISEEKDSTCQCTKRRPLHRRQASTTIENVAITHHKRQLIRALFRKLQLLSHAETHGLEEAEVPMWKRGEQGCSREDHFIDEPQANIISSIQDLILNTTERQLRALSVKVCLL